MMLYLLKTPPALPPSLCSLIVLCICAKQHNYTGLKMKTCNKSMHINNLKNNQYIFLLQFSIYFLLLDFTKSIACKVLYIKP